MTSFLICITLSDLIHVNLIGEKSLLDVKTNQIPILEKSISSVTLRVEKSRGGKIGYDADNLTEFKQRAYEAYGTATSLKTGDIRVTIPSTWSIEGSIFYRQDDPLPMTLLAVIPEVSVGG